RPSKDAAFGPPRNRLPGSSFLYKKPSEEETRKLQQEGKCFICREPGHMAPACPRREKLFKAHDAKIHAMRAELPDEEIELSDDDDGGHETETVVEKDTDSEN
ncbi:hypothetical protein N0V85_009890, partial [Neurospora sp. IMI 360204]